MDGSGLVDIFFDVFFVLIGFSDGFFLVFFKEEFFEVRDVFKGEEFGEVDVDGVVVGIGDLEVWGGEDDVVLWGSGVNRVLGVVMYKGCVMGLVGDIEEEIFSFDMGLMDGLVLGCVMLFYMLGLNVWLICDRMLLMIGGRFEDFGEVVIEFIIEEEEDVVIVGVILSVLFFDFLVIFMVIEEYEGEFLIILDVLFVEFFFGIGLVGVFGNNCCLVGVGGFIILELDELFVFEFLFDGFLIGVEVIGVVLVSEFVVVIWVVVSGVFLLVLEVVCVVFVYCVVFGMWVEVVIVFLVVVVLMDVVIVGCDIGVLLVDG